MNMQNLDPVSKKIEELHSVVTILEDDFRVECAEASLCGNYNSVSSINDTCVDLQEFKKDIGDLEDKWRTRSSEFRSNVLPIVKTREVGSTTNTKKSLLRVSIGNKCFNELTATGTFVAAIEFVGFEKVNSLNLKLCKHPLVSREKVVGYQNQKKCGNWYIITHASTSTMKQQLDKISLELKIGLIAEVYNGD